MMEFDDNLKLTKEEIDNIDDFFSGLDKLADRDLLLEDIDCLDDVKEVLNLKYYPTSPTISKSKPHVDVIYSEYHKIMDMIKGLLEKIKKFIENQLFQEEFKEIYMLSENKIQDQLRELEKIVDLRSFPILIAGEAKAGKSTFINLLIGRDLLPMDVVTCTRTICEIRNSRKFCVRYEIGGKEVSQQTLPEEGDVIKALDKNAIESSEKAIFEYPVEFLNDYTFLVDSPGIGDNQALEKVTYDYINHTTPAFIFVLNSTNSDGLNIKAKELIQKANEQIEGRTRVLSTSNDDIIHKQEKAKAIFILNHWDIVKRNATDKEEVAHVRGKIIEEIKKLWHESVAENKQIFFLSARKAKEWMKQKLIQKEVLNIRQCLTNLVVVLYTKNLENAFNLLNMILGYIELKILQRTNFVVDHKYDLLYDKSRAQGLCNQLEDVMKTMDERKKQIESDLRPELRQVVSCLTKHIKSEEVKSRMLGIRKPVISEKDNIEIMTMILKKFFYEELEKVIKEWNEQEGKIEHLTTFLECLFEKHLKDIGEDISISNNLINKDTLLNAWNASNKREDQNLENSIISKMEQVFIISTVALLFPVVALAGLLALPLILHHIWKEKNEAKTKLEQYRADPDEYLNKVIIETLDKIEEMEIKVKFFNEIFLKCGERIKAFDSFIRTEIEEKRETIKKIEIEERAVPTVIESINKLFNEIRQYYSEYHILRQKYLPDTSLKIPLPQHISRDSINSDIETFVTGHYSMLFRIANQPNNNLIYKMFTNKYIEPYARSQMQEIEFLNITSDFTLKCRSYAFHENEQKLILIFENVVQCNLDCYMQANSQLVPINFESGSADWIAAFSFILDVCIQLCYCLDYLHSQTHRMVHPDLRLGTILVSKSNDPEKVKILLCDACTNLPTVRTHKHSGVKIKKAPEQYLDMGGYTKTNIYSMGLMFYQMTYYKIEKLSHSSSVISIANLFGEDREKSASIVSMEDDIVIDWNTEIHRKLPEEFNDLIKKCISTKPQNRPTIKRCIETLKALALKHC